MHLGDSDPERVTTISSARETRTLLAVLAVLGILLFVTSVPGVFTIDENNYLSTVLSLRGGRLTVPGTEGLTPSRMLAYFDPTAISRRATTSPVASTAPPLYAFFALPFALFGWRGLIALNVIAFLVTGFLVFRLAQSLSEDRAAPWLAFWTFVLAGYSIEYAQGVWPHMLSVALATGGVTGAVRSRRDAGLATSVVAGLLCGVATGVRYQNLVFALAVGAGLLLADRRRIAKAGAFSLAFCLPLAASSAINFVRLGSWNPVSKGPGYMSLRAGTTFDNPVVEGVVLLATRVVDYSLHPSPRDPAAALPWQLPYGPTGTYVYFGAIKKSWIQSSPWILLALVILLLFAVSRESSSRRRESRAFLLVIGAVMALFAAAGFGRIDGVCFNQRYFLELVPLVAVAFTWGVDGKPLARRPLLEGALLGTVLGCVPLFLPMLSRERHFLLLRLPLVLAVILVVVWFTAGRSSTPSWTWSRLAGACLLYSFLVHLGDDLSASGRARAGKLAIRGSVESTIAGGPAALLARWGEAEPFGPLQLDHDLVILDTHAAPISEGRQLVGELLTKGRRVFVYTTRMSLDELQTLSEGLVVVRPPLPPDVPLFELRARTGESPP